MKYIYVIGLFLAFFGCAFMLNRSLKQDYDEVSTDKMKDRIRWASTMSCIQGQLNIINIYYPIEDFKEVDCEEQANKMLEVFYNSNKEK